MNSLLVINSSGRSERSITRQLANRFADGWKSQQPGAEIRVRDLVANQPGIVDERWIAAAFAKPGVGLGETDGTHPLATSDALVDELLAASAVVIGAPMYNFGMPAVLKGYFDQIVRVGRTFDFDPESENPYIPLVPVKPVIVITSKGAGGYEPGGPYAHLNFLEPHIEGILHFVGLTNTRFIRVEFEEFQDGRVRDAITRGEAELDEVLGELVSPEKQNGYPGGCAEIAGQRMEQTCEAVR